MRNTPTPFHASFFAFRNPSHPTLGSHKAPKPLFMLHFSVSKPFPPHSWEPWSTQPCFHASFLAFPDPSHHHEAPKPFFMLHFAPSQALPPLLGTVSLFLMLQTLPTPLLGTMRNTHPFSCFIKRGRVKCRSDRFRRPAESPTAEVSILPTPLLGTMSPPHSSEPFCTFPNPSHPTLGSHEAPKSLFMLHFWPFSFSLLLHELWLSFPPSQVGRRFVNWQTSGSAFSFILPQTQWFLWQPASIVSGWLNSKALATSPF